MNKIIRVISVLYAILFIASQIIIYIMLNRAEITTQESLNLFAVGIIYLNYCIRRDYRLDVAITIALQVVLGIFCVILSIPLGIILG